MSAIPQALPRVARMVAEFLVVGACALGFGVTMQLFVFSLVKSDSVGTRDFSVYWATGRQLAHHANPYDPQQLLGIERSLGFPEGMGVKFMRNPPWALPLVYPLGFLSVRVASVLWSTLLALCLALSVRLVWVLHGRPKNHRDWLGYSFAPALLCLVLGQTSIFALLGLVLFLTLHRARPFWAGCSLWLCTLKPHLFLPFGLVLLLWIVAGKRYRLLAGAAAATAASAAAASLIDPAAWSQYSAMIRTSGIEADYIPCVSFLLRNSIAPNSVWIQYIPAGIACVWAAAYFWPRRLAWDWLRHGSPLLLVSILAAPYCWLFDQSLAIPALLHRAYQARSRDLLLALALATAAIEAALLLNEGQASAVYLWTLWTAPFWLGWYLLASKFRPKGTAEGGTM